MMPQWRVLGWRQEDDLDHLLLDYELFVELVL